MSFLLKLRGFVRKNPPRRGAVLAPPELIAAYQGRLPSSLLELWRKHGFGFYGSRQWSLINPEDWKDMLDLWLEPVAHVKYQLPIALTPFGGLVYVQKTTSDAEEVAWIDPHARTSETLSASVLDFFNEKLSDDAFVNRLIDPGVLQSAFETLGILEEGEVYEADPLMLRMQMLVLRKQSALSMHRRLREEMNSEEAGRQPSGESGEALPLRQELPPRYQTLFETEGIRCGSDSDLPGCYFSSFGGSHELLMLTAQGLYRWLLWSTDHAPRYYQGAYRVDDLTLAERVIQFDIDVCEGDCEDLEDVALLPTHGNERAQLLFRRNLLHWTAVSIHWSGRLGDERSFLRRVDLSDQMPGYSELGLRAPPVRAWPAELAKLVRIDPIMAKIVSIDGIEECDGEQMQVTVNLGCRDGLSISMPFAWKNSGRYGHVIRLDDHSAQLWTYIPRDGSGEIINSPAVGDVLVSRRPDSDPLE